jgi:hypothetical protein
MQNRQQGKIGTGIGAGAWRDENQVALFTLLGILGMFVAIDGVHF